MLQMFMGRQCSVISSEVKIRVPVGAPLQREVDLYTGIISCYFAFRMKEAATIRCMSASD